jgi:hypothetical protein
MAGFSSKQPSVRTRLSRFAGWPWRRLCHRGRCSGARLTDPMADHATCLPVPLARFVGFRRRRRSLGGCRNADERRGADQDKPPEVIPRCNRHEGGSVLNHGQGFRRIAGWARRALQRGRQAKSTSLTTSGASIIGLGAVVPQATLSVSLPLPSGASTRPPTASRHHRRQASLDMLRFATHRTMLRVHCCQVSASENSHKSGCSIQDHLCIVCGINDWITSALAVRCFRIAGRQCDHRCHEEVSSRTSAVQPSRGGPVRQAETWGWPSHRRGSDSLRIGVPSTTVTRGSRCMVECQRRGDVTVESFRLKPRAPGSRDPKT